MTKKILWIIIVIIIGWHNIGAQTMPSKSSSFYFISCAPGQEVYERFGHAAIRYYDPEFDTDWIFHWGVFNFDTPWFMAKFIKGATDYQMGINNTNDFLQVYKNRNSAVFQQKLNLTQQEKQKLYDALRENYLPQNRVYRYNFITDNCATRPYLLICEKCLPYVSENFVDSITTYRKIIAKYTGSDTWLKFGIDLLIGSDADTIIGTKGTISFPLYTRDALKRCTISNDSITYSLVQPATEIVRAAKPDFKEKMPIKPAPFFLTLMVIILFLTMFFYHKNKPLVWLDSILFCISGFIGIILFFLMFFSQHPLVHDNYNLLWLNPLQLLFGLAIIKNKWRSKLRFYALLNALMIIIAMAILAIKTIQVMNIAFLPLMIILFVRSLYFYHYHQVKD